MATKGIGSIGVRLRRDSYRFSVVIVLSILSATTSLVAAPISLTGGTYMQDFNTLALSGTSSTVPAGWEFVETGTSTQVNGVYTAGTGSSATGDVYSFGSTSSSERAFGMLLSTTFEGTIGAVFTNNTGGTITDLQVAYTGEQWRLGAENRVDRINFELNPTGTNITSGAFTSITALDFVAPATSVTGAKDGNLAANRTLKNHTITGLTILNGQTFAIRWTETNATGADDGLAVDDFSLTPTFTLPPPDPMLNEFVANHTGADTMEFVEIIGAVNTNYSAFTILQIEGDSGAAAGTIDSVFTLGTTDANGLWATAFQSNQLENGSMTLLLVEHFTGTNGTDVDTNDDGIIDVTPWSRIVDSVAVSDGGAGDLFYALTVLLPGFDGDPFAVGGASRLPDGTGSWVRNAFDPAAPNPGNAVNTHGALNQLAPITGTVPEPASVATLLLGAAILSRRRVTARSID